MKVKPLVEIALATYNGGLYLELFLKSLSNQSYSNWRLLVRDDGSTDNTLMILNKFKKNISQEMLFIKDEMGNVGVRKNFSIILSSSSAEYIMLADQDDVWLPQKIEKSLDLILGLENVYGNQPSLVFTDLKLIDRNGNIFSNSFWQYRGLDPSKGLKFNCLLVGNVITGCTVMLNRSLLKKALPIPEDVFMHDWWLGLVAIAFGKVAYIEEPLILYRQHDNNLIGSGKRDISNFIYTIYDDLKNIKRVIRKDILKTQMQANAFLDVFSKELHPQFYECIYSYIHIGEKNILLRRLLALRYGLFRSGIVRNITFYLFM